MTVAKTALLARIETHLALKDSSPGFHLSDEDFAEIAATLRSKCDVQNGDEKLPVGRPVAFRVPRVVDDKISKIEFRLFDNEDKACRAARNIGAYYDGLYLVADRRAAFFAQPDPSLLSSADSRTNNAPKCGFCGRAVFGPCMSKAQAAGCELPPSLSYTVSK